MKFEIVQRNGVYLESPRSTSEQKIFSTKYIYYVIPFIKEESWLHRGTKWIEEYGSPEWMTYNECLQIIQDFKAQYTLEQSGFSTVETHDI